MRGQERAVERGDGLELDVVGRVDAQRLLGQQHGELRIAVELRLRLRGE